MGQLSKIGTDRHETMERNTDVEVSLTFGNSANSLVAGANTETLRQHEIAEIYARIRSEQRQDNRRLLVANVIRLWPVLLGIMLASVAPEIRNMLVPYRPWGMWIVFPFVALARRPELQFNNTLSGVVPMAMLYLQFPLEGLLARMALKKRVTVRGVARHVFFMHFLTAAELCMVSGVFWQAALR
jgi:hypothetical protein